MSQESSGKSVLVCASQSLDSVHHRFAAAVAERDVCTLSAHVWDCVAVPSIVADWEEKVLCLAPVLMSCSPRLLVLIFL